MQSRLMLLLSVTVVVLIFGLTMGAQAQEGPPPTSGGGAATPVNVGVYLNPPFVMRAGEGYSGLAFELFEDIARRGNLAPVYLTYDTPQQLLSATSAGQVDIAIGNLTITRARLAGVDFSFPWHDGGLRIMVDSKNDVDLSNLWSGLGDAGHLRAFLWLAAFILTATLLLTLFDRKFDKEFPNTWFEGGVESFYHVMSITTSGKTSRKVMFGPIGKLLAAFWLVFGVAVLAYVTSSVTSVMTAAAVGNDIKDMNDLQDRTVGVLSGGASELYARSRGLSVRPYTSLDAAQAGLGADEIDAVIADAMTLEYFVHRQAAAGLEVVGPLFDPEKYGFATGLGSPLARSISLDLLSSHEDGTTERLRREYLGVEH